MKFKARYAYSAALTVMTLCTQSSAQNFYSYSWLGGGDSTTNGTVTRFLDTQGGPRPVSTYVNGSTVYTDPDGAAGNIQLTGTAYARSGYIDEGTYASAALDNVHAIASGNPGQFYQAAAIAGYNTAFTIYGPSLVETNVFSERFTYSLEGTTESAPGIDSHAFIYVHVGNDAAEGSYIYGNSVFQTVYHTFKPGVSNDFQLEMDSSVDFNVDQLVPGSNVAATTDFYHTLKLTGVDILDSQGNSVKDFQIVDSNTGKQVYGAGIFATPEPASMSVVGLGLIALLRRKKVSKS